MTRIALVLIAAATLVACTNYREPQANCFSLLPMEDGGNCTFTPLGGPENG
ncbi:MAG: hypothetical protein AAF366_20495 [Pseudomonadota bacterium]